MAHPCFSCGAECYCHGDIDDTITSHTLPNCDSCGCESKSGDSWDDDDCDEDYYYDEERDGTPYVICTCGAYQNRKDGTQAKVADCICDSYTVYI